MLTPRNLVFGAEILLSFRSEHVARDNILDREGEERNHFMTSRLTEKLLESGLVEHSDVNGAGRIGKRKGIGMKGKGLDLVT